jgi:hypothetical protein
VIFFMALGRYNGSRGKAPYPNAVLGARQGVGNYCKKPIWPFLSPALGKSARMNCVALVQPGVAKAGHQATAHFAWGHLTS